MLSPDEVVARAVGVVDARGVRGSGGVDVTWAELGVVAPGDGRTWRAIFGRPHRTFRRLDPLSQALLLGAEAAGVSTLGSAEERVATAVVVGSAVGALDTDVRFVASLEPGRLVEAARFAYTLPSTAIGELSMHAGLRGPSIFLSLEDDPTAPLAEATALVREGRAAAAVAARVEALRPDAAAARLEATVIALGRGAGSPIGPLARAWTDVPERILGSR